MTSRELVIRTLNQQPVPRIPRDLWIGCHEDVAQTEDLAEIRTRFSSDILTLPPLPPSKKSSSKSGDAKEWRDAWGCVWEVDAQGNIGELQGAPLAESGKTASYKPPSEILAPARFAAADKACQSASQFVLAWSEVRPLDRLRFLRGNKTALADLGRGGKETRSLLAMLHETACKELELWAATEVDGVAFRDDWGGPAGLIVSSDVWRDLFRPLYREYCKILHAHDKFVFFHANGNISDLFGDLVKLEIDAIHGQLHRMNVERLAKRYRGHTTFWGGFDREQLQNPGSPQEFRDLVLSIRKLLDFGSGGVIAQCEWTPNIRRQTIVQFFEHWQASLPMHV